MYVAASVVTDTHTQNDYCNPRACTPRVNNSSSHVMSIYGLMGMPLMDQRSLCGFFSGLLTIHGEWWFLVSVLITVK